MSKPALVSPKRPSVTGSSCRSVHLVIAPTPHDAWTRWTAQASATRLYVEDVKSEATLFRVRIGPVADVVQYDVLVEELERLGIVDTIRT